MKITTKQLTVTAIMLALCIVSQFFKNLSVYITGPIINLILIVTTMYCGLLCGTILAVITPVTSFFITGSPIIGAMPMIMPCIMIGNEILVLCIGLIPKAIHILGFRLPSKETSQEVATLFPSMLIGSILKALFMSVAIVMLILPTFGTALPAPMVKAASATFSVTQLVTALIGGVLAAIIWPILKAASKNVK